MPKLDWIGKKAVVNHHREVPFHLLKNNDDLSVGDPGSGNLLVQGDNLIALKALLPYYAGQVQCIYIDPPYNTGKEGWIYNDNVNSPEMREWLGKVVGSETDDLSRHDKWLCMMYPRLALAKEFLSPDGAIFISIDDTELPSLRMMMDDLFPHPQQKNRLACFIWQTEGNFDNQAKIKNCHEYILAYSRCFEQFPPPPVIDQSIHPKSKLFRDEIKNTIVKNGPKNPPSYITLPKGFPTSFKKGIIPARNSKWPHYDFDLIIEDYKLQMEAKAYSGWSSKNICEDFIEKLEPVKDSKGQLTSFEISKTGAIECVKRRDNEQSHVITVLKNVGSTQQASQQLSSIDISFDYPKPVPLINYLIKMIKNKSAIVLDFFAGSGTTGHAVLLQNSTDAGNRRFILVEMENHICRNITTQRLSRVSQGYKDVPALGGGFRFCELGEPLFDERGNIRSTVSFADLARHVYFTETGEPLPALKKITSPLLGVHNGTAVYLLYNGILKDKTVKGGNVLTTNTLAALPGHEGNKVIYGTACRMDVDRLRREGIVFKQLPYKLKVGVV